MKGINIIWLRAGIIETWYTVSHHRVSSALNGRKMRGQTSADPTDLITVQIHDGGHVDKSHLVISHKCAIEDSI